MSWRLKIARLRWRLNTIPELRALPQDEQQQLWRMADNSRFRPVDFLWLLAILSLAAASSWAVAHFESMTRNRWLDPVVSIITLPIAIVFGQLVFIMRHRYILRRLIKDPTAYVDYAAPPRPPAPTGEC